VSVGIDKYGPRPAAAIPLTESLHQFSNPLSGTHIPGFHRAAFIRGSAEVASIPPPCLSLSFNLSNRSLPGSLPMGAEPTLCLTSFMPPVWQFARQGRSVTQSSFLLSSLLTSSTAREVHQPFSCFFFFSPSRIFFSPNFHLHCRLAG